MFNFEKNLRSKNDPLEKGRGISPAELDLLPQDIKDDEPVDPTKKWVPIEEILDPEEIYVDFENMDLSPRKIIKEKESWILDEVIPDSLKYTQVTEGQGLVNGQEMEDLEYEILKGDSKDEISKKSTSETIIVGNTQMTLDPLEDEAKKNIKTSTVLGGPGQSHKVKRIERSMKAKNTKTNRDYRPWRDDTPIY